ncbi:aminotransferase [Mesoterricola silvestris]|uniref:alanine--glyoxylate transaminase n=2 Tax=Mesoterricola silvestris TaxID=2927979 RepID=A0AA48KB39_9BACT|nr:aminotransferase [Mesoterricola silvestris]
MVLSPLILPHMDDPSAFMVREKHMKFIPAAVATYYDEPLVPLAGKGSRLVDLDGKTYLDFFGGILTVALGHAHDRVTKAVIAQLQRLSHASTFYPTIPMVELAEKLIASAPGQLKKVFFTVSGSEADEMAVTLAQAHTGNLEVITLRHSYAGRTVMAQALDGLSSHRAVQSQIGAVKHAPAPYCYRCPLRLDPKSCGTACARDLKELVETTTTGRLAGMLVEPILGAGGCIPPPPDYFAIAAEIVRKHGGVMIADEVQTGFGRTGKMWGAQHFGLEPEIMTLGKGIANGLPMAATLCTEWIADSFTSRTISTFGGNPLACAAAGAVLDEIKEQDLVANSAERGKELRESLVRIQRQFPRMIGDVRGVGLMLGMELVRDETTMNRTPATEAVSQLMEETRRRGLLIGKGGLHGNIIRIAPPLNVSAEEIEEGARILMKSFSAIQGG